MRLQGRAVSAGKRVEGYTPEQEQKMGVKVWLKPKYWATTQAASLPIQAPLMAAAIAPTVVGGALGGPLGAAVGATAGAAISRPAESYLEAGQAYTEAKQLGYDEEIARKVADMVFKENLKIGVADIPELAALFAPIPSPLAKGATTPLKRAMLSLGVGGAKVGSAAIKEAAEEFAQERIQSQALAREPHSFAEDIVRFAQPSTWTPEEASAALAGGFMGALFGGTGVANRCCKGR